MGNANSAKEEIVIYKYGTYFVISSSYTIGYIEMYHASGKMIMKKSTQSKEMKLDTTTLAEGVYIIKVSNNKGVFTKKIMKL